MLAIIVGSGLTRLSTLAVARREVIRTPYGEPSAALVFGQIGGRDVVFLARHGQGHTIPPHRVNYRANLWALKKCGVASIVAVASVGAVAGEYAVGDLVLPHQLIDYTTGRENTFFDGGDREVVHVDLRTPLHRAIARAISCRSAFGLHPVHDAGVCAAVSGQGETAVDRSTPKTRVNHGQHDRDAGGRSCPRVGCCVATIAVVVNRTAGRGDSAGSIDNKYRRRARDSRGQGPHIDRSGGKGGP
jgi:5'-methylthioadenosine phosphorylase